MNREQLLKLKAYLERMHCLDDIVSPECVELRNECYKSVYEAINGPGTFTR